MSQAPASGPKICVRCGRQNDADVSFCVECGFDLRSALQRDYDGYRETALASHGPATSPSEAVSAIASTSPGVPGGVRTVDGSIPGSDHMDSGPTSDLRAAPPPVTAAGSAPFQEAPPERAAPPPPPFAEPTPPEPPRTAGAPATSIPGPTEPIRPPEKQELTPFDVEGDVSTPSTSSYVNQAPPQTRPVRENLREGVTTYVDATQRSFTRPMSQRRGPSLGLYILIGVGLGLVALGVLIVLTR